MRQPHHAVPDSAEPRILHLPTAGVALRGLLDEAVSAARSRHADAEIVEVAIDAAPGTRVPGDAAALRGLVDRLVSDALVAATRSSGDGPPLHEVVVTVVETADAIEVEIADSGSCTPADDRCPAAMRELATRCGCRLHVAACPEGGMAVTVRLPRRDVRRQAA
ncbi:MAG: hypothetical protein ACKO40_05355 [Planctomycetaceae bacterium]